MKFPLATLSAMRGLEVLGKRTITPELAAIVGPARKMRRTEVSKKLWASARPERTSAVALDDASDDETGTSLRPVSTLVFRFEFGITSSIFLYLQTMIRDEATVYIAYIATSDSMCIASHVVQSTMHTGASL